MFASPDAQIGMPLPRATLAKYWKERHDELKSHALLLGEDDPRQLKPMGQFYRRVGDNLYIVVDIARPRTFEELALYGFGDDASGNGPGNSTPGPYA